MSLRPLRCPFCQARDVSAYTERREPGRLAVWAHCLQCHKAFGPAEELHDLGLQLWSRSRATDPDYGTLTRHLWDQYDILRREYFLFARPHKAPEHPSHE